MAFRDFEYPDVVAHFGLTEAMTGLFADAPPVVPSLAYQGIAPRFARFAAGSPSAKAKSEFLIAPLLSELWAWYEDRISLYSECEFVADAEAGMTGVFDFVFGRGHQIPRLASPMVVVAQVSGDDLASENGRCIASMVGIQRASRNAPESPVFGLITTGSFWKIKRLTGSFLVHDTKTYGISPPDKLLGALVAMIESLLAVPA